VGHLDGKAIATVTNIGKRAGTEDCLFCPLLRKVFLERPLKQGLLIGEGDNRARLVGITVDNRSRDCLVRCNGNIRKRARYYICAQSYRELSTGTGKEGGFALSILVRVVRLQNDRYANRVAYFVR